MKLSRTIAVGLALVAVAAALAAGAWRLTRISAPPPPTVAVGDVLGGDGGEGFARALGPRALVFPDDHGPHPEYRTEWWYYTGNLRTASGRHFGFQLTFFRLALAAAMPARSSAWASRQAYMAHFALTDTDGQRFHASSRLSRAALNLAGARARPFRVWVDDWSAEGLEGGGTKVRLRADEGGVTIDLTLEGTKRPVLQGDRGLDRKGPEPGNASYYYSLTRMSARGRVSIPGATFDVDGLAWMDREWGTSALGRDLVGWDWMALQLDDGRELMLYQLRRADGRPDRFSGGSLVAADGSSESLGAEDFRIDVGATWASPRDGVRYPSRWRLSVPGADLVLDVVPRLADQELVLDVRYWEGAVRVEGAAGGRPLRGQGYVELVGYAGNTRKSVTIPR